MTSLSSVKYLSSLAIVAAVVIAPCYFMATWASEMTHAAAVVRR